MPATRHWTKKAPRKRAKAPKRTKPRRTGPSLTASQVRAQVTAWKKSAHLKEVARDLRRVVRIGKVVASDGRVVRVTWSTGSQTRFHDGKFVRVAKLSPR